MGLQREDGSDSITLASAVAEGEEALVSGPVGPLGTSEPSNPLVDTEVGGDGVDNAASIANIVLNASNFVSDAAVAFLLAGSLNQSLRSNVAVFVDAHFEPTQAITSGQLINALAATAVHEIAHTLGAVHTGVVAGTGAAGDPVIDAALDGNVSSDIMLAGLIDLDGALSFQDGLSTEIVKIGLAGPWTGEDANKALDIFSQHVGVNGAASFSSANHPVLVDGGFDFADRSVLARDSAGVLRDRLTLPPVVIGETGASVCNVGPDKPGAQPADDYLRGSR